MIAVDKKDQDILEVLDEHADFTTRKISKATRLPITTVHNRIRKMKEQGIITKYTVEKDFEKLGKPVSAFILVNASLKELKEKRLTQISLAKRLKAMPFVEEVSIVTGEHDMVLKVRLSSIKDLNTILLDRIQTLDGVERTQTLVNMQEL